MSEAVQITLITSISAILVALASSPILVHYFKKRDKTSKAVPNGARSAIRNPIQQVGSSVPGGAQLIKWERDEMGHIVGKTDEIKATEELFFSGNGLARIITLRETLCALPDTVHIRLLTSDTRLDSVRYYHKRIFDRPLEATHENLVNLANVFAEANERNVREGKKKKLDIRTVDFPITSIISARDMSTATGLIQVAFPDYEKVGSIFPCVELNPGDAWYKHYEEQIELLWAQATPWAP